MRIERISENIKLLGMPELTRDELKDKYGPEGDYNTWRKQQAQDFLKTQKSDFEDTDDFEEEQRKKRQEFLNKRGSELKQRELKNSEVDTKMFKIEDTKIDIAAKVSDILGNSLKKGDSSFLEELNNLIDSYSNYRTTINPNAKVIDIDEPFKVNKFGDLPITNADYKDGGKRKMNNLGTNSLVSSPKISSN